PVMQWQVVGAADRVARQAEDRQAETGHLAGEGLAGLYEVALDDVVDEPDPLGFGGIDRASGQDQFGRARLPDEPRQSLGPAIARDEAELDLGKAQPGGGRRQAERAGKRQFETAPKRIAVDEGDRRQWQLIEP